MNLTCHCRFCDIGSGTYAHTGIDEPVFISNSYFSIATIGAIVYGWSLLVPYEHCYSMRRHYANAEFFDSVNKLLSKYFYKYDQVVVFEHGANKQNSLTSCGTSHAHLHIVPAISIYDEIINTNLIWNKCLLHEISILPEKYEYLYYTEINRGQFFEEQDCLFHILEKPSSQFFRKIISEKYGIKSEYDYNLYPYINNSKSTRDYLAGAFSVRGIS